jgi:heat shock protein HtpX
LQISNSTKVWIFVVAFSLGTLVLSYQIGERLGLLLGFLLTVGINILIFYYGDSHLLTKLKAQPLDGRDPWGLIEKVHDFSHKMNIPPPSLYLIDSPSVAICSVGHSWRRGAIGLTSGLLTHLNPQEIDAVLVYQIHQIHKLDSFIFGITSTVAFSIIGFGKILDQFTVKPLSLGKVSFFTHLFSPLSWLIICISSPKSTFFRNDQLTASVIPDRFVLAEALWKLQGASQTRPLNIPSCTSHLFIVNPYQESNWFFKIHPPISARIRHLVGYFPI